LRLFAQSYFEQLSYFSQVGVGVLTGGKNGNQTTTNYLE